MQNFGSVISAKSEDTVQPTQCLDKVFYWNFNRFLSTMRIAMDLTRKPIWFMWDYVFSDMYVSRKIQLNLCISAIQSVVAENTGVFFFPRTRNTDQIESMRRLIRVFDGYKYHKVLFHVKSISSLFEHTISICGSLYLRQRTRFPASYYWHESCLGLYINY